MSIKKMTAEEFSEHQDELNGLCLRCFEIYYGGVEPDAEEYYCDECDSKNEIWEKIRSTRPKRIGRYTITLIGNVYSRYYWHGDFLRKMKTSKDKDGYLYVRLTIAGKRRKYFSHKLVCTLFHGKKPSIRHEVRHLDGNRSNNAWNNLAWDTK